MQKTKKCSKCGTDKDLDCFHKRGKNGYQSTCKTCKHELSKMHKDYDKQYYLDNKEDILLKQKTKYENNKESILARQKIYYISNKEQCYLSSRNWYLNNKDRWNELVKIRAHKNPEKAYAHTVLMRNKRKNRVPVWADISKMQEIYKKCRQRSIDTGIPHEVDHIVPLCGKAVSGLHIESNLRIIPKTENRKKSNKFYLLEIHNGD